MAEQADYSEQIFSEINARIRDVEEKQRILKDKLLLIGQNLVEIKDTSNQKMLEMKKDIEMMKQSIERMSSFLENISEEFSKFAKKEDLEILTKQAKMFQPLELMNKRN